MRPSALVAIALSIAALVMSLLVLLAGRDPNHLKDIYILNIDTTGIAGNADIIPSSSSSFLNSIGDKVDDVVGQAADAAVNALGVHDLYSWKVLNFCYGDQPLADTRAGKKLEIQWCDKQTAGMRFDLKDKIENDLLEGKELPFEWPEDAEQANDVLKVVSRVMTVLYIVGVGLTGLVVIMSILGLFIHSRIWAFLTSLVSMLAFVVLGAASALITVLMIKLYDEFTKYLSSLGFKFAKSKLTLGLTWTAVGCLLIVTLYWFFAICFGTRRNKDPAPATTRRTGGGLFGRRSHEARTSEDPMVEEGRVNEKTYADQRPGMMGRIRGMFARRQV